MTATDKTGFETLKAIEKAASFNRWMFSSVSRYCTGNILEIGSGIGNISKLFVSGNFEITLSDNDNYYLDILYRRFNTHKNVKEIISIDLQDPAFNKTYLFLKESYTTIFMLNVLEHLENEKIAIQNCNYLLKSGGTLIILVPAYPWLFSRMDKELGHKKRYIAKQLKQLLTTTGFFITKTFYFNAVGIPAWLYGKILKLKNISANEMKVFDHLTGLGKLIDKILFYKTGLSIISVAKKP